MHAIKSRARHAAWRNNYNPWLRRSPSGNRKVPDEEIAAASIHSNECVDESLTTGRREEQNRTNREFPPPKHAPTFGTISESEPTSATSVEREIKPIDASTYSEDTQKTAVASPPENGPVKRTTTEQEGPRARRHKLRVWKNKHDDSDSPDLKKKHSRLSLPGDKDITILGQVRAVLFPQWLTINWLLFLVPVGFAMNYAHVNGVIVFVINFLAIIPLAGILSYATEEIAMRVGETLGGLLNATFGNAVELIVSILALVKDEIIIVQTSLIGSMLSNLLLVMGMCFFFGGVNRVEQFFNVTVAQTAASLLALAIGALIIPTAFHSLGSVPSNSQINTNTIAEEKEKGIAPLSRGTAVILLVVYASYLIFQLKSHVAMYNEPSQKVEKRKKTKKDEGESLSALAGASAGMAGSAGGDINNKGGRLDKMKEEEEDAETPQLTFLGAIITLAASTVLVAFCAEFMVDGIQAVTCTGGVSQTFVGLILLPIVGNAAEHATAVTVAIKDKMDLAIGVAVGSSMQIALLVLPFMVVLGWIMGKSDMTLYFDGFQIAILFVSILLVNYLIQDGKTHWLEGVLLLSLYLIISVAAWFYPQTVDLCKEGGQ